MGASEIKTILQSVQKYPQQNLEPYRNQPNNLLRKSIDWFSHNTSLYQRYLRADFNGTFQGIKKKNKKSLVRPESYSEPPKKSRQRTFLKDIKTTETCFQKAPSQMPDWALNTLPLRILSKNFFMTYTHYFKTFYKKQIKLLINKFKD